MRRDQPRNLAASVRQRLFNLAQKRGDEFQLVLTHYGLERLLYRLTRSPHAESFILKGAMLFYAWDGEAHRPTRDLDLLLKAPVEVPSLEATFRGICAQPVEDDGLVFKPETVRGSRIQEDDVYAAIRITCEAELARAHLTLQVDVGFGDPITPAPRMLDFPTLLEFPAPRLRAYTRETVVAEKFEAMVKLGMANSRMKDFYDVWLLARRSPFDGDVLAQAFKATFARRKTPLPTEAPLALSPTFGEDRTKQAQWRAFLVKGRLDTEAKPLREVVPSLGEFLLPPARAAAQTAGFAMVWPPGGPWRPEIDGR